MPSEWLHPSIVCLTGAPRSAPTRQAEIAALQAGKAAAEQELAALQQQVGEGSLLLRQPCLPAGCSLALRQRPS